MLKLKSQNYNLKLKVINTRILIAFLFFVTGVIFVHLFWRKALLLSFLLVGLAFFKHKIIPIKKEIEIYLVSGLIGSLGESFVILNGAWQYSQPHIFNFPIWLPLLWGLAGITGISFYLGLTEKK